MAAGACTSLTVMITPGQGGGAVQGEVRIGGNESDPVPSNNVLLTQVDAPGGVTVLKQGYAGPPILRPVDDPGGVAGRPLSLSARVIDPDPTRTITYTLVPGNPPVSSIDSKGVFTYTPASAPLTARFVINVTDDSPSPLIDFKGFTVSVATTPLTGTVNVPSTVHAGTFTVQWSGQPTVAGSPRMTSTPRSMAGRWRSG